MNNPFGIPDEVMDAVIRAAMNTGMRLPTMEKPKTENIFSFDIAKEAKKSASMTKQLYDAYVEAGFTQEQAFELVKGILTAKKN